MSQVSVPVPTSAPNRGVFLSCLVIVILALLLLFGINIRFPDSHANDKHPGDPKRAEDCLNQKGVMYAFVELSGRIHLICSVSDDEFYDVVMKDRGAADGSYDGVTAFRAGSYRYQGIDYEFNNVHEYAYHLQHVRGWTPIDVSQFQGPFRLLFP